MAVAVETLENLERKMTLTLPVTVVTNEVENRLRKLSRQVKLDGFRPGKVPFSIVAQRYGYSVQYEVINDKVGEAFQQAANDAKLRVAGGLKISESETKADEGQMNFDAVFEVYPEVKIGELSDLKVEKTIATVSDEAIDRTLEILRKQRRTFSQRSSSDGVTEGDRVTLDFVGKIDGEPFEGGKAEDFVFMVGEGQMLKEFDDAVRGMKLSESKTFPLSFPADYHGQDVAGKTADFLVTVKKLEAQHLPEVNEAFAKSLNIADGSVTGLREDIKKNLEREVKFRVVAKNKGAVMDALIGQAQLDLPKSIVQSEVDRLMEGARADLKQRGIKDADKAPLPDDIFRPQAERRVRLGLVVAELVKTHQLEATADQIKAHIDELAASYEKPADVIRWYQNDRQRLAEVEAVIIENNVSNFVLSKAQVTDKSVAFDELMGQQ